MNLEKKYYLWLLREAEKTEKKEEKEPKTAGEFVEKEGGEFKPEDVFYQHTGNEPENLAPDPELSARMDTGEPIDYQYTGTGPQSFEQFPIVQSGGGAPGEVKPMPVQAIPSVPYQPETMSFGPQSGKTAAEFPVTQTSPGLAEPQPAPAGMPLPQESQAFAQFDPSQRQPQQIASRVPAPGFKGVEQFPTTFAQYSPAGVASGLPAPKATVGVPESVPSQPLPEPIQQSQPKAEQPKEVKPPVEPFAKFDPTAKAPEKTKPAGAQPEKPTLTAPGAIEKPPVLPPGLKKPKLGAEAKRAIQAAGENPDEPNFLYNFSRGWQVQAVSPQGKPINMVKDPEMRKMAILALATGEQGGEPLPQLKQIMAALGFLRK